MAPRTVWAAHSSAVAISSVVAPPGARSISIRASCLVPVRRRTSAVATSADVLAASGSVGRNAYDEELVALELLLYLQKHYPQNLEDRFKLGLGVEKIQALHHDKLLEAIGRKRGCVMSGGRVNLQKAAEIVITDYRTHVLGRITLETPAEFEQWAAVAAVADAERQAKKDALAQSRKKGRKPR